MHPLVTAQLYERPKFKGRAQEAEVVFFGIVVAGGTPASTKIRTFLVADARETSTSWEVDTTEAGSVLGADEIKWSFYTDTKTINAFR